jgi:hypothetical protein
VLWQADIDGGYPGGNSGYSINDGVSWVSGCPADQLFEVWGNPCLEVSDAKVFTSYISTGDWLITCLYKNFFPPYFEEAKDVSTLFYLQLVDGTTVKAQTKVFDWGYRPGSIYLAASEVTSLEWGRDYKVRMYGNFGAYPYAEYSLQSTDWLGDDLTRLDFWCRSSALLMEAYYSADYTEYLTGRGIVLNAEGGVIFANNIPELTNIRPSLFKIVSDTTTISLGNFRQSYQDELAWQAMLGTQLTRSFTSVGNTVGLGGSTVGALIGFIVYVMVALLCFRPGHAIASIVIPIPILLIIWGTGLAELALMGILLACAIVILAWQAWFKGG